MIEEAQMTFYAAIDLHSNNSVLVVTDETDRIVFNKRLPNELERVKTALAPYAAALDGVVVESTFNWYWLVDGLKDAGHRVRLANTAAIATYSGLKHSNDEDDAAWLCHLSRVGLLKEGWICPPDWRGTRDLLRRRLRLVQQRTAALHSIQLVVARATGGRISGNRIKRLERSELQELAGGNDAALELAALLELFEAADQAAGTLEREVLGRVRADQGFAQLKTIPGIGDILGMTIHLETGDPWRFDGPGRYASYCRCVKADRLSNGKRKGEGNRRNGNRYLSWAFVEAAHMARRYDGGARRFYERKQAKSALTVLATKALAHKLARAAWHVMTKGEAFDPKRCFG
jgi:transposase